MQEILQGITPNAFFYTTPEPEVILSGSHFMFSGKFALDKHEYRFNITQDAGGSVSQKIDPTVDYLVVGSLGNTRWKHEGYGKKIEDALYFNSLTEQGKDVLIWNGNYGKGRTIIKIVTEAAWFRAFSNIHIKRTTPNNSNIFWREDCITASYLRDEEMYTKSIEFFLEEANRPRRQCEVNWEEDIKPFIEDSIECTLSAHITYKRLKTRFKIFNGKEHVLSVAYDNYEHEVIGILLKNGMYAEDAYKKKKEYQAYLLELKGTLCGGAQ